MDDDQEQPIQGEDGPSAKIIRLRRPSAAHSAAGLASDLQRLALDASASLVGLVATADQYGVEVPAPVRQAAALLQAAATGSGAHGGRPDPVNRRQLLGSAAAVAGALALRQRTSAVQGLRRVVGDDESERVAYALSRPSKVDASTVAAMEAVTAAYRRSYRQLTVRALLPQAQGQAALISQLLGGSMKPALRRRLTATAAEATALVGVMLLMDLYAFGRAWSQLTDALGAAQDAKARELEAFILGCLAFTAGYTGRQSEAIDLITQARRVARTADGLTTRGWLAAVEGELRARAGDPRACLAALEDAEVALQSLDSRKQPPWIGVGAFDSAKLKGYYGLCYLQLHQPHNAVSELATAVDTLDPSLRKHRCTALADLASALIRLGEVEEGCRRASQALALAIELRHAVSIDRIRDLDHHLAPWGDSPAVKAFREQLLEQLLLVFQTAPSIDW